MVKLKTFLVKNRHQYLMEYNNFRSFIRDIEGSGTWIGVEGVYKLDYRFLGEVYLFKHIIIIKLCQNLIS